MLEKRREFNLEIQMAYLDLEKLLDRVERNKFCQILKRRGLQLYVIRVIKGFNRGTGVRFDTGKRIL
jgi:hypothetical protein